MGTKILVQVSGGLVVGVWCSDPQADVEVIDHDNLRDLTTTERKAGEAKAERAAAILAHVW